MERRQKTLSTDVGRFGHHHFGQWLAGLFQYTILMMGQIISGFGELLLRLSPQGHEDLIVQSNALEMGFAGAEANILADLAHWGQSTQFITALPENPLGKKAVMFLNQNGVSTHNTFMDEGRMGSYYVEHGTAIRATQVTYDRKDSSFARWSLDEKDWEKLLENSSHFVVTGITPALSENCQKSLLNGLKMAQKTNCKVIFDLNFRRSLWSATSAKKSFSQILPHVDVLLGNLGAINDVFDAQIKSKNDFEALQEATVKAIDFARQLGSFQTIAMTIRQQINASENILGGMLKEGDKLRSSLSIPTTIKDRLGGGDAFAAGILLGKLSHWEMQKTLDFATAAFATTQTLKGDINYLDVKEILSVSEGNLKGHVKR
ncbi:MAG: sugar kinase [Flavobacteriaceae bacterium]|jgi:2-dehydro-3-deoxygluconokinase|nr:sugar kinase [Flavobacteriaceae bacterium]